MLASSSTSTQSTIQTVMVRRASSRLGADPLESGVALGPVRRSPRAVGTIRLRAFRSASPLTTLDAEQLIIFIRSCSHQSIHTPEESSGPYWTRARGCLRVTKAEPGPKMHGKRCGNAWPCAPGSGGQPPADDGLDRIRQHGRVLSTILVWQCWPHGRLIGETRATARYPNITLSSRIASVTGALSANLVSRSVGTSVEGPSCDRVDPLGQQAVTSSGSEASGPRASALSTSIGPQQRAHAAVSSARTPVDLIGSDLGTLDQEASVWEDGRRADAVWRK